ncbi:hypothetical protein EDD63_13110 [Breznakia blatticola]|uniref:Helicase HerA-like C-terminal domain-containing protein n=1 Tax=Breznakia blatticola TaxID=1754012 RepID=A0A4V3G6E6_9FIRM|nr:helicase HerA-like domain-containing protein [Breznakia blatticola]TDW14784.1 hypothetical protein EDD63_13110 [Breznakia blatticola]
MYIKDQKKIWIASTDSPIYMLPSMANRHGLIAGATGTGKTVTLKVLTEAFSDAGVPVFLADIKGDVSGLASPGVSNKNVDERIASLYIQDWSFSGYPTRFYDIYGEKGTPVRTTISDLGPDLLARILELNDIQSSVLKIVFKIADEQQLLLFDIKDVKAMLQFVDAQRENLQKEYGNIASATIGAIIRSLVALEASDGNTFIGEPELDIKDWLVCDPSSGQGIINILHAVKLAQNPVLYSTFLLWLLSEIYETLPEAGDLEKPKMVFFFDEAHLLFNDAPKALLDKVEQVVKLIRSKGVGVYFITQQPTDIPNRVLSQLGNKIQHALRAYTPAEQKSIKATAESFRINPAFDTEQVLQELGTGEALVSFLDAKGVPTMVERATILPPRSYMGAADDTTIENCIRNNPVEAKYRMRVDSKSAYEELQEKTAELEAQEIANKEAEKQAKEQAKLDEKQAKELTKLQQKEQARQEKAEQKKTDRRNKQIDRFVGNALSSIGRNVGNSIIRGIFGTRKK